MSNERRTYKDEQADQPIAPVGEGKTYVRVVVDQVFKCIVHWGNDTEGKRRRIVCPGPVRKQTPYINPKVCPVCEMIAEVGQDDAGWNAAPKFYVPVETIVPKEKKFRKKDGTVVEGTGYFSTGVIKLLGGRDGIPVTLYNMIESVLGQEQFADDVPGIALELSRKGTTFETTKYTGVVPIAKRVFLKPVEELKDPGELLSGGLEALVTKTSLEQIKFWIQGEGAEDTGGETLDDEGGEKEAGAEGGEDRPLDLEDDGLEEEGGETLAEDEPLEEGKGEGKGEEKGEAKGEEKGEESLD